MNFTREPIIETIITPKEGFKLLVRNSKGGGQEEYQVDSVEVVSFGHSFFFRSLEKPKSFLVPVSDYEIVETKEVRVALKNASIERAIKIGGGREAPMRREGAERAEAAAGGSEGEGGEETQAAGGGPGRSERRGRDRRRHRRRRGERPESGEGGAERAPQEAESREPTREAAVEGGGASEETQVSSSMFTTLFPPPPTLISETISRYKEKDFELPERGLLPESVDDEAEQYEEKKKEKDDEDDDGPSGSEGSHLSRIVTTSSSLSFASETSYSRVFTPPFGGDFR